MPRKVPDCTVETLVAYSADLGEHVGICPVVGRYGQAPQDNANMVLRPVLDRSPVKVGEADPPECGLEQEGKEISGRVLRQKGLRPLGGDQHFPATAQKARDLEHNAGDMNR